VLSQERTSVGHLKGPLGYVRSREVRRALAGVTAGDGRGPDPDNGGNDGDGELRDTQAPPMTVSVAGRLDLVQVGCVMVRHGN
jgi:hypothetical protein